LKKQGDWEKNNKCFLNFFLNNVKNEIFFETTMLNILVGGEIASPSAPRSSVGALQTFYLQNPLRGLRLKAKKPHSSKLDAVIFTF